jgi:hypothetical protein
MYQSSPDDVPPALADSQVDSSKALGVAGFTIKQTAAAAMPREIRPSYDTSIKEG